MRFITSTFFAIAALAGLVMAAENPIVFPDASSKIVAGTPFTIVWTPTTGGTCTFTLRQGPSDNLNDVSVIVSGTPNTGTYQWTPAKTLPAGTNYAIMITDSKGNVNYTPLITIQSDVKSSSTSSSSTSASTSTTAQASLTSVSSAVTTPATMTQSYSNSTMITSVTSGYTNATSTGNLTHSTSHSTTPTSSQEPVPTATGAASGLLKSPLALVVCVLGAVLYLN